MEMVLIALVAALGVIAFASGRGWTLLMPFVAVPAFYLGLQEEWWGNGLGDGWHVVALGVLALAVAVAGAGLILHRITTSG